MSIQFPIEVWQLADRYAEAIERLERSSDPSPIVKEAIEISRQLQSTVDRYLTSDATIEISTGLLLTLYRDPLNRSSIYVLATQQVSRPHSDRPPTEPIDFPQ